MSSTDPPTDSVLADAPIVSDEEPFRSLITQKELSECDREQLHHIGVIQGDTGHLLMFEYPSGRITAHDQNIRKVKWIRHREGSSTLFEGTGGSSTDETSSLSSSQSSLNGLIDGVEHVPLLGENLHCWIPYMLYMQVTKMVEDMKKARSQRAFYFFTHRKRSYALSVSTTSTDFFILAMEIEEDIPGQAVRSVLSQLGILIRQQCALQVAYSLKLNTHFAFLCASDRQPTQRLSVISVVSSSFMRMKPLPTRRAILCLISFREALIEAWCIGF
jgi:hypothetical protein